MKKRKCHDMSDFSYTLLDPKDKGTWTKELRTMQFKCSQHMRNLSVILCTPILMHFFTPHKYLMKWVQTKAI